MGTMSSQARCLPLGRFASQNTVRRCWRLSVLQILSDQPWRKTRKSTTRVIVSSFASPDLMGRSSPSVC